jgi:hypothetical protein
MDADDFLDQIVAHGRVAAALDELRRPCTPQQPFGSRQRRALGDLLADLRKGSAYVEEVCAYDGVFSVVVFCAHVR